MKRLLLVLLLWKAVGTACAQGTLAFNTYFPPMVDARVFDVDGKTPLAGPAFVAQLYVGMTESSLAPVSSIVPFGTGEMAGYIGSRDQEQTVVVLSISGGNRVQVQVRAWRASDGSSYEAAVASRGHFGTSNSIRVLLGDPNIPTIPALLIGLQGFSLIPEPSSAGLFTLGAAALWLIRSRGRGRRG